MSGPSEKAVEAGDRALIHNLGVGKWVGPGDAFYVLRASHDPALGLDHSVCPRDVVEFVREVSTPYLAASIEREFGGVE